MKQVKFHGQNIKKIKEQMHTDAYTLHNEKKKSKMDQVKTLKKWALYWKSIWLKTSTIVMHFIVITKYNRTKSIK